MTFNYDPTPDDETDLADYYTDHYESLDEHHAVELAGRVQRISSLDRLDENIADIEEQLLIAQRKGYTQIVRRYAPVLHELRQMREQIA